MGRIYSKINDMEENENESGEPENDNSKKVEITEQDLKDYLSSKFDQRELPGGNARQKTTAEMLRDAENHK
jgi:hypothetical protein